MFKIKPTKQLIRERGLHKGGKVRKFIDSEVIRCMDAFVPFATGFLKRSVFLGTVIGSGIIRYNAPYARKNYYSNKGSGVQGTQKGGRRGRLWFERMKPVHLVHILDSAAKIANAKWRR